jgi:hypothetical protein
MKRRDFMGLLALFEGGAPPTAVTLAKSSETRVFGLGRDREFADSPLERNGFELPVPRQPPEVVFVSIHVRADFSVRGIKQSDMSPSRTLGGVTRHR